MTDKSVSRSGTANCGGLTATVTAGSGAGMKSAASPSHALVYGSGLTATVTSGAAPVSTSQVAVAVPPSDEAAQVRLRCANVSLGSETGKSFVTDCARNIEGLKSDRELQETWGLDEEQWRQLSENTPLLNAVKGERERRIRSGEAAREAAQRHFATTPSVLAEILNDELISPRHRIEAARELRHVAANGPETSAATEKYIINIDLGGDDKFVLETEIVPRPPSTEEEEW